MKKKPPALLLALWATFLTTSSTLGESERTTSIPTTELQEDAFLLDWICLDGIDSGGNLASAKRTFANEPSTPKEIWESVSKGFLKTGEETYNWNTAQGSGASVDFNQAIGSHSYQYTYALSILNSDKARNIAFGIGSNDSIKLWVNGELLHQKWTFRQREVDQELVKVNLVKGENRFMVKVPNSKYAGDLSLRPLKKDTAEDRFGELISNWDINQIDQFLELGFDIDAKSSEGLTALQDAQCQGKTNRANKLLKRGAAPDLSLPDLLPFTRKVFENAVDEQSAGLVYLLAKDGKIIAKDGLGMANIESRLPNTTKTKFPIGSVTKQFTATAILKLQEKGLLSIEDLLSKYIPDFPRGNEVTLRHLLNHTSGIGIYTKKQTDPSRITSPITQVELIEEIKGYQYDFDPGSKWKYNNSGYFILGYIVSLVSKQSLFSFWKDNFFDPIGMNDTIVYPDGRDYKNEAIGYAAQGTRVRPARRLHMSWATGAGDIYSTVEDLFLWNEALFAGEAITLESFREATTPTKLSNGEIVFKNKRHYGMGFMMYDLNGHPSILHSGLQHGFEAMLARVPEKNLTYVFLSNSRPSNLSFQGNLFKPLSKVLSVAIESD